MSEVRVSRIMRFGFEPVTGANRELGMRGIDRSVEPTPGLTLSHRLHPHTILSRAHLQTICMRQARIRAVAGDRVRHAFVLHRASTAMLVPSLTKRPAWWRMSSRPPRRTTTTKGSQHEHRPRAPV